MKVFDIRSVCVRVCAASHTRTWSRRVIIIERRSHTVVTTRLRRRLPVPYPRAAGSALVPADAKTPDLVHRFYQEQQQIDRGAMDRYAAVSDAEGLVVGYYRPPACRWRCRQQCPLRQLLPLGVRRLVPQSHLPDLGAGPALPERAGVDGREARREREARHGGRGDTRRLRREHGVQRERAASCDDAGGEARREPAR